MIEGSGSLGVEFSSNGFSLADNRREVRLFKITSGSNPYAADEIVLDESDGSRDAIGVYSITTAQKALWEVNGNTSVAANTIVEAVPNPAGNGFWFSYQATSSVISQQNVAIGSDPTGAINLTGSWTNLATLSISATGTYLVSHHMTGLCQTIGAPSGAAANIGTRIVIDSALDEFATLSPTLPWAPVYWCQAEGATVTRYESIATTFPVSLTSGDTLYSQGKFYVGGGAVIGTTAFASIRGRNTDTTPPIGGPQSEARLWAVRIA